MVKRDNSREHFDEEKLRQGLLKALEKDKSCLNTLTYETKNGSTRKLSKTATSNIVKFLLCDGDDETIKIDI